MWRENKPLCGFMDTKFCPGQTSERVLMSVFIAHINNNSVSVCVGGLKKRGNILNRETSLQGYDGALRNTATAPHRLLALHDPFPPRSALPSFMEVTNCSSGDSTSTAEKRKRRTRKEENPSVNTARFTAQPFVFKLVS